MVTTLVLAALVIFALLVVVGLAALVWWDQHASRPGLQRPVGRLPVYGRRSDGGVPFAAFSGDVGSGCDGGAASDGGGGGC